MCLLLICGCQPARQPEPVDPPNTNVEQTDQTQRRTTDTDSSSDQDRSGIHFVEMTADSGVDFVHFSGDNAEKPFPAANGSGIGACDYDLDGRNDLLFLTGTDFPLAAGNQTHRNQLYRNLGDWKFTETTNVADIGHTGYSAGVAIGDANLDGFPDVYINCYGKNQLYWNNGDGTFNEGGADAGVDCADWGTSAAFLDFDSDGDLDLYVCNYGVWTWETNQFCGDQIKNIRIFCAPRSVKPAVDVFYENLGNGLFQNILESAGLNREPGRGQGVVAADIDGDRWIDLYVGNDANANFYFRNTGQKSFEDLTDISGAGLDYAGREQAGMGVDIADIDRDGALEIFVTNYEDEHNTIYVNRGENFYEDASQSLGITAASVRWVGWGTRFADFDADGWTDLVVTNGHTDNNLHEMGRDSDFQQPPLLFQNNKGHLETILTVSGYFAETHAGRTLVVCDLDNDQLLDLVIGHQDEAPALLRNDTSVTARPLSLKLIGTSSNRDGIGVQVEVLSATDLTREQVKSGGSYLASSTFEVHLPANDSENIIELQITWPSGIIDKRSLNPNTSTQLIVIEGHGVLNR